ncbi:MAG: lipopolysaccharide heptosyltransferase I [Methylococcales bacterium]|nr:lipopolysaccharide heptosyltransferase I [Methylococcales bacterium]
MKIAIVKLSALGDIIHAMVGLQFIKAHNPDSVIDWIVEPQFADVLRNNPDIHQVLTVNLKAIKHQKSLLFAEIKKVRQYADHHYDLVIDAQGLLKSAIVSKILGKHRAGFDKNSIREKIAASFYTHKVQSAYDDNTIDRNAKVLSEPLGFQITSEQIHHKKPFLFFKKAPLLNDYVTTERKNILFVIGSTWESRNYPKEKFLKVAQILQQNTLIIWGSQPEKEKADWIAHRCENVTVLPKLTLNDLKALMAKMDVTLGNDTGPSHLAWGLNKPSLLLFGCTPVSRVYQTAINHVLKSSSVVDPFKLNKHDDSIADIEVHQVVQKMKELLHL